MLSPSWHEGNYKGETKDKISYLEKVNELKAKIPFKLLSEGREVRAEVLETLNDWFALEVQQFRYANILPAKKVAMDWETGKMLEL